MTKPMFKSRSWKKRQLKTPGGRLVTHYSRRNPKAAKCSNCGKKLPGVPRVRPTILKKIVKSKRRPERPYGGKLCSSCTRELFRSKARA
jgi:large subunit ribosomal protein L34e